LAAKRSRRKLYGDDENYVSRGGDKINEGAI
jgi:hypothetical protein